MNFCRLLFYLCLLPGLAWGKENPFTPLQQKVRARTGYEVAWVQDLAAREEAHTRAQALLARPLTSGRAVQVALLLNPDLQATFEELGLSFADLRAARTLTNPGASLEVKFPDRAPTGPLYEWDIAQNFLELLLLPLRARVAREQMEMTRLRLADEVVRLVSEVKIAFRTLQADDALRAQLRTGQDTRTAALTLMRALREAGNVPELSLSREEADFAEGRVELLRAETETRGHREQLTRLLGVSSREPAWSLAGALPPVPAEEPTLAGLEERAVANRLDLAAARLGLANTLRALGLEKQFRFIGALDFGIAGETDPDRTKLTGPSVHLELPVFNQGQAKVARAEAQLRRAQAKFEGLALAIRSAVREQRDRLLAQRDLARLYAEQMLPARQRITAQTLGQYNAMQVGAFEAFEARREEAQAQRGALEAARDYWIARAELERTVGGDLDAPLPKSQTR